MITVPPETEQLVRRLAAFSGKTPEDVLKKAVEAEALLAGMAIHEGAGRRKEVDMNPAREIIESVASKPILDKRGERNSRRGLGPIG
jgi:hypothetical protein